MWPFAGTLEIRFVMPRWECLPRWQGEAGSGKAGWWESSADRYTFVVPVPRRVGGIDELAVWGREADDRDPGIGTAAV